MPIYKSNFKNITYMKREQKYGDSRFDIYFEYDGKKYINNKKYSKKIWKPNNIK